MEGCLAVAWETVLSSRSLTSLRILCNPINLRQLSPVPGLHTRYFTVTSNSCNRQKLAGWSHQRISTVGLKHYSKDCVANTLLVDL